MTFEDIVFVQLPNEVSEFLVVLRYKFTESSILMVTRGNYWVLTASSWLAVCAKIGFSGDPHCLRSVAITTFFRVFRGVAEIPKCNNP